MWKGISRAKILKNPEDLLKQKAGSAQPAPQAATAPVAPTPPPASTGKTLPPPPGDDSVGVDLSGHTVESLIDVLVNKYKKEELIAIAESIGVDTDGNKADIAERIAESQLSG